MGRCLNGTVMVDGVVYPAGTDESDIDGEISAQGIWTTDTGSTSAGPSVSAETLMPPNVLVVAPGLVDHTEVLEALREFVAAVGELHAADAEIEVADLFADAASVVFGDAPAGTEVPNPEPKPAEAVYLAQTKPELEDEIDRRNADRDQAGETYIFPGGKNKPDLVAALVADDARIAGETQKG